MLPPEMRAKRPTGRASQRIDDQVRDRWKELAWVCQLCGQPIDPTASATSPWRWTKDHILPIDAGGGNDLDNLQPAHLRCNQSKGGIQRARPPRRMRTSREW
jgi:5-methylcytosine-specific restriction endonuclease McrA